MKKLNNMNEEEDVFDDLNLPEEEEFYEITEEVEVDISTLSKDERRAYARTGVLPVIKQNIYTRFDDENPQFGK